MGGGPRPGLERGRAGFGLLACGDAGWAVAHAVGETGGGAGLQLLQGWAKRERKPFFFFIKIDF